jgi:tRNA/rRNA methyltransferase
MPKVKSTPAPIIILVDPQLPENIGAVARAMANFGASDLRLVRPLRPVDEKARRMACDGEAILLSAKTFVNLKDASRDCHLLVGTSRRARNVKIMPQTPKALMEHLAKLPASSKIAFCFGSERTGLSNQDLFACDLVSSIPVSRLGSLNLGQAAVVYLYEWFAAHAKSCKTDHPISLPATHEEKERMYALMRELLIRSGYAPAARLPEFMFRIKHVFENRPLSSRQAGIFLKMLRFFEKKIPSH